MNRQLIWSSIDSENINFAAYDKVHSVLYVKFINEIIKAYKNVPAPIFDNLTKALKANDYFEEFVTKKYLSNEIDPNSIIISSHTTQLPGLNIEIDTKI